MLATITFFVLNNGSSNIHLYKLLALDFVYIGLICPEKTNDVLINHILL